MLKFVQNPYLVMNGLFKVRVFLDRFKIYFLDCDSFMGGVLETFEHFAKRPLPKAFVHVIAILPDRLD